MNIYIVGAVTGIERSEVIKKFTAMELKCKEMGFVPVNPVNLVPENTSWADAMKTCIMYLIHCDSFVKLPCWQESKGGMLEVTIARNLDLTEFIIP